MYDLNGGITSPNLTKQIHWKLGNLKKTFKYIQEKNEKDETVYAVVQCTMEDMHLKHLLEEMIVTVSLSENVDNGIYIVNVKDIHYPLFCIPKHGS